LFRIAQNCPDGFSEGTRTQDDENVNNLSGPKDTTITTLPKRENTLFASGYYTRRIDITKWYFCCGSEDSTDSISFDSIRSQLPDSFVLFKKVIHVKLLMEEMFKLDSDTTFYYCTYGPSFRIFFFQFQ